MKQQLALHLPTTRRAANRSETRPRGMSSTSSDLTARLAARVADVLSEDASIYQHAELEAQTWPGRQVFVVDLVVEVRGRRVGIEMGTPSSLREHAQLRRRDARLVATGVVDAVYRVTGDDVSARLDDVLHMIASWERAAGAGRYLPDVFSARGRVRLARLSAPEARALHLRPEQSAAQITFAGAGPARRRTRRRSAASHLLVRRFDRRFPAAWNCYEDLAPLRPSTFVNH